jgi:hypothetical protein
MWSVLVRAGAGMAGGGGGERRLLGMMRNTTDPACLQRRVPCSSLSSIEAGGAILPSPGDVPGLGFIQALQVAFAGGGGLRRAGSISYSIATDPNATGSANTVLAAVDAVDGSLAWATPLPFVHVSSLAEGMFLHADSLTGELLVVGEMDTPPASLPGAVAGDHIVFRFNPATRTMAAVGFFGGEDSIASVGAYDAATGILWAQCINGNGKTYSLLGMDTHSGRVAHNVTDPYMAGGMACSTTGRCFLIGITREDIPAGASFERVLVELTCRGGRCALGTEPLLRLPGVCIILGGLMAVDTQAQTIYGVLQNNSATSPCGGMAIGGNGRGGVGAAADLVWRRGGPTGDAAVAVAAVADAGFKLLAIDFSSKVPVVVGEPVLCASLQLCPVSIAVAL